MPSSKREEARAGVSVKRDKDIVSRTRYRGNAGGRDDVDPEIGRYKNGRALPETLIVIPLPPSTKDFNHTDDPYYKNKGKERKLEM